MTQQYLPTQYQPLYYVYFHKDPVTAEIVYVGSGTKERAWTARPSNRQSEAHMGWLRQVETDGYTPDQFVSIEFKSRNKREVLDREQQWIEEYNPIFNRTLGKWWWCLSLSEEQLKEARELRKLGVSYKKIAKTINTSTMTVWRAINGETKGYAN